MAATDTELVKAGDDLRQAVAALESLIDQKQALKAKIDVLNARITEAQAAVDAARAALRTKAAA